MAQSKRSQQLPLILLVEDFAPLSRNAAFLLEVAGGYNVLTVKDGAKALDVLQHVTPDLIISDIDMPNVNGYELLRRVRASQCWQNVPFIFCSDKYEFEDLMYGLDLGANDYVPKPFDFDELLLAVRRTLPQMMQRRLRDTA